MEKKKILMYITEQLCWLGICLSLSMFGIMIYFDKTLYVIIFAISSLIFKILDDYATIEISKSG